MLLLPLLLTAATPISFDTVATKSKYTKTGRLDELTTACAQVTALKRADARCAVIATSPEGRPMTAFTLGTKGPRVLVIGGIHAGEIDGKDASLQVMSELLNGKQPGLDDVTVVFVPVYNVDGHERMHKNNRPNQRGPEEMGWRVTSQNLNLNRDWSKADAKETRALLALMEQIDPAVVVDLHVTDGAQFQHDIAVLVEPSADDGSEAANVAAASTLSQQLQTALKQKGHLPLDFYPAFEADDDPTSGFSRGVTPARLTHGYVARRGRIGVLVETHSWQPYQARVTSTANLLRSLLSLAKTEAPKWQKAAQETDAQRTSLVGKTITIAWDTDMEKKTELDFLGYAYTRTPSTISGGQWTQYDEKKKQTWRVPFWGTVKPSAKATAPAAYAVLPGFAAAVSERLSAHGVAFTTTKTSTAVDAQRHKATKVEFGARPYEGRQTAKITGAWQPSSSFTLPAGSLIVPVAQPRGRLVVELFEPGAPEALSQWGFYNAVYEQKEYMEGYVAEAEARAMLKKEPKLQQEFDAALASDPELAKSPEARLDWFYRRHPAYDENKDLLPVLRLNKLP